MKIPIFKKYGDCINILVDDVTKYVAKFDKIIQKTNSIEDVNGNQIYSAQIKYPTFKESFKHGVIHTYSSKDNEVVITHKDRFKNIIEYNNKTLVVEKYPKGKYTFYPIFIDGFEIAEGVLLNSFKNFNLDFDIYLLKEYESNYEAICMLCAFLYCTEFRELLSSNKIGYEKAISIFPKDDSYNPNWLKSNFNINL